MRLYGAIEGGGTKFRCAIFNENQDQIASIIIPTTTPKETLTQVIHFFHSHQLTAIGIGMFGPIIIDSSNPDYGLIKNSPKLGWNDFNVYTFLKKTFDIPVIIDTDVNAACLGEFHYGSHPHIDHTLYLTFGTGIGGGFIVNNQTLKGSIHPEMGHISITRDINDLPLGVCPYHESCLEGFASARSIELRYHQNPQDLSDNHMVWNYINDYIAQAIITYILILSPKLIILGGGLMNHPYLLDMIREKVYQKSNAYIIKDTFQDINQYIIKATTLDVALKGAFQLAYTY